MHNKLPLTRWFFLMIVFVGVVSWGWSSSDMQKVLDTHDPTTDSGASSAVQSSTTSAAPQPTAATNPETSNTAKELERYLSQLQAILKSLEQISAKIVDVPTKKPADSTDTAKKDKYPTTGTVRVDTSLNVRTAPWGNIIGSLYEGDQVQIIGREGDWYKVSRNGQTVYLHANYVEAPGAPAGRTPVVEPGADAVAGAPVTTGSGRFGGTAPCSPMPSYVSSPFGWRIHPTLGTRKHHDGVDLPVPTGTRLNALGDGVVTATGWDSGGGYYIKVRYDNGLESFYCHLQRATVAKGQRVSMGQEIAKSDNTGAYTTGPHLHLEIRKNGTAVNPAGYIKLPG